MRNSAALIAVGLALALGGCRAGVREREESISKDAEKTFQEAEAKIFESRTLSGLAKLEEAVAAYTKTEDHIPRKLEDLIPKYLADMPTVELGVRGHRDTTAVQSYPSDVLRDGRVDGTRLKDSGRWGYVYNERQVVIFVDCTHKAGSGTPWYQERGVY